MTLSPLLFALLLPVSGVRAEGLLATPLTKDPMAVTLHRLDNGLTVYLSPNPEEPRVYAMIAVRTGSKEDPADSTGMAHYLEHMLFKGSQRLGTLDFVKEKPHLDRILRLYEDLFRTEDLVQRKALYAEIDAENVAASVFAAPLELWKLYDAAGFRATNAFTSYDQTVYLTDFPSNRAELWARLEADRFARPVFRLFQTEIETVYEEKNRALDNPGRILNSALNARLYPGHAYGREVLGEVEHLKNPSLAKMYAYYAANYRPENMAVVLSGDFDRAAMLALVRTHFGGWQPGKTPRTPIPPPAPITGTQRVEVTYKSEEAVVIAWRTVPALHPDSDALAVMDMVLDNSSSGLLNLRLEQAQKVKSASSSFYSRNDAGAHYLTAVPRKGQTLEQAEALLLETVEDLKKGEFEDSDLRAILLNLEIGEKRGLEDNSGRARTMADAFLKHESWEHRVAYLDRLRAISKADVVAVARKYLGGDRVIAYRREGQPRIPSIEKPSFTKVAIDPDRRSDFYRELAAIPATPLEPRWLVDGRDYRIQAAPWGKLYAAHNPLNDLFALSFRFDRGRLQERRLCAAMDLLERSGAGDMGVEALEKALYALGASMSVACDEQSATVSLSGVDANLERSLELLFQRFESPNVATDTLKQMVEIKLGAHKDNKKNPNYVQQALGEYATRGAESAVLSELTDAELEKLDLEDLKSLMRSVFDYQRRVEYVGRRDPTAAAALLTPPRREFKAAPKRKPLTYLRPRRPRVIFTHRDMVQAQIGLFASDGKTDPREEVPAHFYNVYVDPLIWEEVREARALAYTARGGFNRGNRTGDDNSLWGYAGTQADKTNEAAVLLGGLLARLPLSPTRFKDAANEIEQRYRAGTIRFRSVPETLIAWELQGITDDPRPARFQQALAFRPKDLERFAKRFKKKALTLYILGSRDRVDLEALKNLGDFEERPVDQLFPY